MCDISLFIMNDEIDYICSDQELLTAPVASTVPAALTEEIPNSSSPSTEEANVIMPSNVNEAHVMLSSGSANMSDVNNSGQFISLPLSDVEGVPEDNPQDDFRLTSSLPPTTNSVLSNLINEEEFMEEALAHELSVDTIPEAGSILSEDRRMSSSVVREEQRARRDEENAKKVKELLEERSRISKENDEKLRLEATEELKQWYKHREAEIARTKANNRMFQDETTGGRDCAEDVTSEKRIDDVWMKMGRMAREIYRDEAKDSTGAARMKCLMQLLKKPPVYHKNRT